MDHIILTAICVIGYIVGALFNIKIVRSFYDENCPPIGGPRKVWLHPITKLSLVITSAIFLPLLLLIGLLLCAVIDTFVQSLCKYIKDFKPWLYKDYKEKNRVVELRGEDPRLPRVENIRPMPEPFINFNPLITIDPCSKGSPMANYIRHMDKLYKKSKNETVGE